MLKVTVPKLEFVPAMPANLPDVLEAQVRRLIEIGVPQEVRISEAKFFDDAMATVGTFVYSVELMTAIGLDRVCVVHYDVSDRFLADAGGVRLWTNPDKFVWFEGVTIPQRLQVIQGQFGPKYKNVAPRAVRQNHANAEELGIPKEGLAAFNYWGVDLLRESYMDFPGAVSENGNVPYLCLGGDGPGLGDDDGSAYPGVGSVSVSRGR